MENEPFKVFVLNIFNNETYVYFDILLELRQWVLKFGTNVLIEEMINAVIHQNSGTLKCFKIYL